MHSKDSNSYDKIPSKYINSVSDAAHSENEMVFARAWAYVPCHLKSSTELFSTNMNAKMHVCH